MKKYITVNQLHEIVNNKISGNYLLYYWNLDYNHSPEILKSDAIKGSNGEFYLDGHDGHPFPINDSDEGDIRRFNNCHYEFSLFVD